MYHQEMFLTTKSFDRFAPAFMRRSYLFFLECMYTNFHLLSYVNTPEYTIYANRYQHDPRYIDYSVELPKIKNQILELEVGWYIENLTNYLEIENKEECPSYLNLFQSKIQKSPSQAHSHQSRIRTFRSYRCKNLLRQCQRFYKDIERYSWCLAGMVTLLNQEEQDPFQQNGIYQRWQNTRITIQQTNPQQ
ncbi:unnamed protein product (macronuclear) [Paramecium tetraurelia]|uniref:Uncharacterized protein n=1 Tax=Paramecium tetraurelia TaxID=5888 RepID=A0BE54_PARTE|nr:uncharacterized protein GSPATT00027853001 [Paramecium tetraurelia]CAK56821.1 unnamed protein product [Paramecium tetraurelia]|eukprot:XP_001424219.1 hypothetical protein (macronuclear) [Paramecium tetraurelia strain d4-2]